MNNNQKTIYVYENWTDKPSLLGWLYVQFIRGEETFSFEFNADFLKKYKKIYLDPQLYLYSGRQYSINKELFGIFMDSCPDRWGRMLLKRRENELAIIEQRQANTLFESDYLLGIDDYTRMGALRFSLKDNGDFLSSNKLPVPPLTSIRELEQTSIDYEKDNSSKKWLELLVAPGSSLGGARPKGNVVDENKCLWIAKFPSKNDEYDVGAWEYVSNRLAQLCGIVIPEIQLMKLSKNGSTFLSKRFDRIGEKRIHYASAITLLGKTDGDSYNTSYLDIANFINQFGSNVKEDLLELWKRLVFNIIIHNTDDHLRNHGFLLSDTGWKLSPVFDINPNLDKNILSLNIIDNNNELSLKTALDTAYYYKIQYNEAKNVISNMIGVVSSNWRRIARDVGINQQSIKEMETIFDNIESI